MDLKIQKFLCEFFFFLFERKHLKVVTNSESLLVTILTSAYLFKLDSPICIRLFQITDLIKCFI